MHDVVPWDPHLEAAAQNGLDELDLDPNSYKIKDQNGEKICHYKEHKSPIYKIMNAMIADAGLPGGKANAIDPSAHLRIARDKPLADYHHRDNSELFEGYEQLPVWGRALLFTLQGAATQFLLGPEENIPVSAPPRAFSVHLSASLLSDDMSRGIGARHEAVADKNGRVLLVPQFASNAAITSMPSPWRIEAIAFPALDEISALPPNIVRVLGKIYPVYAMS